jgi:negative regulator of PHO system
LFCAGTEVEIVELIFRLLGTPQGALLNTYKHYPDWEKINFNKTYTSRLQSEYSRHFDTYGLQLLDRLLDINPQTRVTAKDALDHRYFAPDTVVPPSL